MTDQALRQACTTVAYQLFAISHDSGAGGKNPSTSTASPGTSHAAATATQRRLQAAAVQVSDAAMGLYRLCGSRANGEPIAILPNNAASKGGGVMDEAAYCVCAIVRAVQPWFWLALTRRAVVLRPRQPVLRLGAPTPLPIVLQEIERFAGRSQRIVERVVKPLRTIAGPAAGPSSSPLPSSSPSPPRPSASSASTVLTPVQGEQLAVCYFWAITTPAERRKFGKHGGLYEVSSLPPSLSPERRRGASHGAESNSPGRRNDGLDADDADAEQLHIVAKGGYRRDKFWHALPQRSQGVSAAQAGDGGGHTSTLSSSRAALLAAPELPSFGEPSTTTSTTATNAAITTPSAAGQGLSLRRAVKRGRESAVHEGELAIPRTDPARAAALRPRMQQTTSRRAGAIARQNKVVAAQARLYSDDLASLMATTTTHETEAEDEEAMQGEGTEARAEPNQDEEEGVEATHTTITPTDARQAMASHPDKAGADLWNKLVGVFEAPEGSPVSAARDAQADTPFVDEQDATDTCETPTAMRLAPRAARLLTDVIVAPGATTASSDTTSVEVLCAKIELVKSHLYWTRLEACVENPLWLSQTRYGAPPATPSVSSSSPSSSSPLSHVIGRLYTRLGSLYHPGTPLPTSPPAWVTTAASSESWRCGDDDEAKDSHAVEGAASPSSSFLSSSSSSWSRPALAACSQAHFLAPSRARFGVGLDVSGPLLSSRPMSLVTAPLLWTRLVLCAAWLRSYAVVYLPVVLAERATALRRAESGDRNATTCDDASPVLSFDTSAEAVHAQQAIAAFCLDVVQDAFARFRGGVASSHDRSAVGTAKAGAQPELSRGVGGGRAPRRGTTATATAAAAGSTPRATKHPECPVCDGLMRQAPPIRCGALRDDQTVLQERLRAHHLPSRGADPHALTPLLPTGTDLGDGVRESWQTWRLSACTQKTRTAVPASPSAAADDSAHATDETEQTREKPFPSSSSSSWSCTTLASETRDLHLRALARRLHALVESLIGLQRAGLLGRGQARPSHNKAHVTGQKQDQMHTSHHHHGSGEGEDEAMEGMPTPKFRSCPDLLPLSSLDPVYRATWRRQLPTTTHRAEKDNAGAMGAASSSSSSSSAAAVVTALYDAYGWAAPSLFAPLLSSNTTTKGKHTRAGVSSGAADHPGTTPTPSLAALTDMMVRVVVVSGGGGGAVPHSPWPTTPHSDVLSSADGLTHWQRCALVWHSGSLRVPPQAARPRTPSPPLPQTVWTPYENVPDAGDGDGDGDGELAAVKALRTTQAELLAWLDFFPAIPLVREEDGVIECARCFTLFHQRCVCPSQRDVQRNEFLCHSCRIREATP